MGKAGAKFDFDKTKWFNQQYLRLKSKEDLAKELQQILKANFISAEDNFVEVVCELLKERATFVRDIWQEGKYFFLPQLIMMKKQFAKNGIKTLQDILKKLKANLSRMSDFSSERIEEEFKKYIKEKQLLMGKLLPVFRVCLTGVGIGPSIFEIASLLGQQEVVLRMEKALNTIK